MSHEEEKKDPTQEQETKAAVSTETADELQIVDAMKPSASPASANKPLRYGTRKSRPGAKPPAVAKIGSISEATEEDILEMDDLPVRANAPKHLIDSRPSPSESRYDDEDRPRRERRPRGERRPREDRGRERSPEKPARSREENAPLAEAPASAAPATAEDSAEKRPERFAMANDAERRARPAGQVMEFRPSRDGRTAEKPAERQAARKPAPKKGLLAKIISFFTGGDSAPAAKEEPRRSDRHEGRRSPRGPRPEGRSNEGDESGDRPRRRRSRNRNRKPRPEGEGRPERSSEGQSPRGDGEGRRRRRRRRGGEGRGGEGRREPHSASAGE